MSAIAKEKFAVGDRVRMTERAINAGLQGHKADRRTGIVRAFPTHADTQDPNVLVVIRRDGEKRNHTYHMDFWERDSELSFNRGETL